jgi:hypothetical protein
MADYVAAIDAEGRHAYISPAVERDVGYPAAALPGTDAIGYVHPADVPESPPRSAAPSPTARRSRGWTCACATPTARTASSHLGSHDRDVVPERLDDAS